MSDPSIARFRRVISSAYASLEARRQEVNDLNVFPVADGDTGDNMAMTLRAVMEELDRLDGQSVDEVGRTELVQALARAALMGARGNSGVILSQIVRGAAEELASRPGELVDPTLVAAAFAKAADAAYDSVREPAEGTMLTVFREMAHSLSRQLAHLQADQQRLGRDVSDAEQDAVLARVLEKAIEDGERAVARTPEQLEVLRESGVVDAGGHGLVLILAGVVAGLRGDGAGMPEVPHHEPPRRSLPHHEDSRYRYCTNFIVSGTGLENREYLPRLERLGDSVLVVGDDVTLKVHVHTDEPEAAVAVFDGVGEVTNLDVADMREQMARRDARLAAGGRTGVVAVAAGDGLQRLFGELGAHVVPGGETLNPSTYELLAGIHSVASDEVLVLPSSSNVIMAAERACELSDKPARVVPATSQQASLLALVELDPEASLEENAERLGAAVGEVAIGGVAPAARDDVQGRFEEGEAVGFVAGEIVAWGAPGSTVEKTLQRLAEGAEIVTIIAGEGAPIALEEIEAHVPDGVEVETHEGGQPSWWWLLAAQ
ncbi:MAG TPA: DAK2 domain-containing protein [Solirubrobacterales bacterium]|nr:DAK2 domain-containing protein [Solirubrobacterales bacterium]